MTDPPGAEDEGDGGERWVEIGRRYSREFVLRTPHGGLLMKLNPDRTYGPTAVKRFMHRSLEYMRLAGVPVDELIAEARARERSNEGEFIREWVTGQPDVEQVEEGVYLAARLYEVARLVQLILEEPDHPYGESKFLSMACSAEFTGFDDMEDATCRGSGFAFTARVASAGGRASSYAVGRPPSPAPDCPFFSLKRVPFSVRKKELSPSCPHLAQSC